MATVLDKDLTRETTVKVDEREIQITLTEQQNISMKLKGMKSGVLEIPIEELYHQLRGDVVEEAKPIKEHKEVVVKHDEEDNKPMANNDLSSYKGDSKYLISIHDIRHSMLVSDIDYDSKLKFERFLVGLINERKERVSKK